MTLLDKSAILAAQDCRRETISVPEWGGFVSIRAMSGAERDDFRAATTENEQTQVGKFEAFLLALTLVDENGHRLFELAEVETLRAKSAAVLDKLSHEAMRINGMGINAQEDAVKNSEAGQNDASGSGLPKS